MNAKKPIAHLTVSVPGIKKLRIIRDKMSSNALNRFVGRYGDILDLLKVKVQEEAITALIQFYDPPLRCFTFQDFKGLKRNFTQELGKKLRFLIWPKP